MADYLAGNWTDEMIKYVIDMRETGYTFPEIAEKFNDKFIDEINQPKSSEAIRWQYRKYHNFSFTDDELIKNIQGAHNAKKRSSKTAKENRILLDHLEQQKEFEEILKDVLKANPPVYHKPAKVSSSKVTDRVIFAHLSDTHFQANIDGETMGGVNRYTNIEEARRLAYFCNEVANYKKEKRKDTELVLTLNGDLAQGIIHDQENTPLMTTQFSATLHLLRQAISFLAGKFKKVRVICTSGNHLRYMHKSNKGRQTNAKWDGFHTNIYVALRNDMEKYKNVEFEIPATPYALVDILGHKFFITHGDTVLAPGNVGKNVSTERLKNDINDLIAGLGNIDVVVMGHVHIPVYTILNNGSELVINGTMSGVDEFAQSIGIVKNHPSQQMFEVTKDYAVGDMRFVRLMQADTKKELDKIIKPFKGKF